METSTYRKFFSTELIALCFGILAITFSPILIKFSSAELGANAIMFHRFWVATLSFGIWNKIKNNQNKQTKAAEEQESKNGLEYLKPQSKKSWLILLGIGLAETFCMVAWAWSLERTSISHSTLLHNLTPIFTTFGGWLFLGQYFDKYFLMGVTMAIAGSVGLIIEDWEFANAGYFAGDQAALLSALAYSIYLLAIEQLRSELPAGTILFWKSLVTTVCVIPAAILFEKQIFPNSWVIWLAVILQGLLCEVIGQGAVAYSLKKLSSGFVSLFLLLEPVFVAISAWIIFNQALSALDIIAFCIILSGIYLSKSSQGAEKIDNI